MRLSPRDRALIEEAYRRGLGRREESPYAEEIERCRRLNSYIASAWHVIEPDTEYLPSWHIDCISEHLEAVTAGQITRLLINMPPRYMKSIAVSVMWPTWEWRERPGLRYMFATYASSLSEDHSTQRRLILNSEWYQERWGRAVQLVKDGVETVENTARGQYVATSFTGTATGKGGNRVVIDDPHNPKQAESEVERKKAVRLFNQTFSNRLNNKKRDAVVVVMQRLHEEDVSARCLELGYVHLCLPAESEGRTTVVFPMSGRTKVREDGELLWPEREGPKEIADAKAQGSYYYAGQYQQRPAPAGGGMFQRAWFKIVEAIPSRCSFVRYWDKAGTEGGGAFSAGVLMARSRDGEYYLCDITRGQWSSGQREAVIRQTAELDGHNVKVYTEQEPGSGGKESAENTVKNLEGYDAEIDRVTGEKTVRARPLAAQAEVGNVYLLRGEWNRAFIDEACLFPNGKYKDQVDAASGAFNKLALKPRPTATLAGGKRSGLQASPGRGPIALPKRAG